MKNNSNDKKRIWVDIFSLSSDQDNVRKHDEKNIKSIMLSLKEHGQRKPLVVFDNIVIAGNGTLEAAKRLGWTEIEINNDKFKSKAEAKAYAIRDNRSAELAAWDFLNLDIQLSELEKDGYLKDDLGFEDIKWDEDDSSIDDIEENLNGITATIKIKCPQEIKDEVFIFIKARLLETSFVGVEVV